MVSFWSKKKSLSYFFKNLPSSEIFLYQNVAKYPSSDSYQNYNFQSRKDDDDGDGDDDSIDTDALDDDIANDQWNK